MTAQDDRAFEALLAESGLEDDPVLTDLMADLRGLGEGPAPRPVPAVAALLAPVPSRRRPRRRGVVVGLLVAATLGGGAAAAAAAPAVRDGAAASVSSMVHPAPVTVDQPVAVPATSRAAAPVAPARATGSPAVHSTGGKRAVPAPRTPLVPAAPGTPGSRATAAATPAATPSASARSTAKPHPSSDRSHGSGKGKWRSDDGWTRSSDTGSGQDG